MASVARGFLELQLRRMECQETWLRIMQELNYGEPFVLFTKLGVHISGKSSQKGFKQVSDIVTLIMDPLATVRPMNQERQKVLC